MKHPNISTLQDYFENELNSVQVEILKNHLIDCNHCTTILSQMAKVDVHVKNSNSVPISSVMKDKIFADAKVLLEMKRKNIEHQSHRVKANEVLVQKIQELIYNTFEQFKVPAFQLASLSLLTGYIVWANQTEKIIKIKPIHDEVIEYLSDSSDISTEGDKE